MSPITVFAARRILTMNPAQPEATHLAVRDGRILAVGDLARCRAWGPAELDERFAQQVLLPGFVEGHCHLKEGGMWAWPYLGWFDRRDPAGEVWNGLRSMDEVVQRLAAIDAQMPAGEPLVAWGFDPIYFGGERMSTRHLDRVGDGSRCIVIGHANGHVMNVNSAMLRRAGIDAECEVEGVGRFPEGGPDAGQPDGELAEPAAMYLVLRHIGQAGLIAPMDDAGMRGFAAIACREGVTTATDLVNKLTEADVALLRRHTDDEGFAVRLVPAFQAFHGTHGAAAGAEHVRSLVQGNTERLRFGLVKMMLDGSIQGFSARLRWPGYFSHPRGPQANGIWVTAPSQYEADAEVYHRAGLTVHTHTNGDEASEVAVQAWSRILAHAPRPGHRHTLQHGQMIDRALFERMAALGLGANLFANHLWYWGDAHHDVTMGPDRAHRLDACRSALQAGVRLAIHSDAPVTPLAPLFTAWCAVHRLTPSGRVLGAHERLSVPEALQAITWGAAWTLGLEHEIGSLEVGKRADCAVLDEDPLSSDPMRLKDLRVAATVLGGRVFRPGELAAAAR
ncbi:MAG: amidohydrolase [Rubrivivax sp.]|nr:amidohydrolase [Rubrivivax sp.]